MNSNYSDNCEKPSSHNYNGERGTPAASFALKPNRQYNTISKGETKHSTVSYMTGGGRSGRTKLDVKF